MMSQWEQVGGDILSPLSTTGQCFAYIVSMMERHDGEDGWLHPRDLVIGDMYGTTFASYHARCPFPKSFASL